MDQQDGGKSIDSLTGIRFVAAFAIAAAHIYPPVDMLALIGMPLFFTLSGFIIHFVYSDVFGAGWRPAAITFAAARFSRIYPLYLLLLLVAMVITPMGASLYKGGEIADVLAYVFACWTWLPISVAGVTVQDWYFSVSWSVATEIFFYIAYAFLFYRLGRIESLRVCLAALVAFCLCAYALFYLLFIARDAWEPFALQYFTTMPGRSVDFQNSFYRWLLYFSPYARIFEFVAGCLTCQLFLLSRRRQRKLRQRHAEFMAWLAVGTIVALVGLFHLLARHQAWLSVGDHSFASFFMTLHMNFLLAPFCCLLLFALATSGGTTLSWLLSTRIAVLLGEISYSTYLGHFFAIYLVLQTPLSEVRHVSTIAKLAAAYLLSLVLYRCVEVPAKLALRRIFARLPTGAPPRSVRVGDA